MTGIFGNLNYLILVLRSAVVAMDVSVAVVAVAVMKPINTMATVLVVVTGAAVIVARPSITNSAIYFFVVHVVVVVQLTTLLYLV